MVGTFISKYLLVTTSTITVTSSAAVTFFVAKHLKIGKEYNELLNYIRDRYELLDKMWVENEGTKNMIEGEISDVFKNYKTYEENKQMDYIKELLLKLEKYKSEIPELINKRSKKEMEEYFKLRRILEKIDSQFMERYY